MSKSFEVTLCIPDVSRGQLTILAAEIVLSVLLMAFKFELTDKPVIWNFSVVEYPTMGESSTKPELLLKVTPL